MKYVGKLGSPGYVGSVAGGGAAALGSSIALILLGVKRCRRAEDRQAPANCEFRDPAPIQEAFMNSCLDAFRVNQDAWVMLPARSQAHLGQQPIVGVGAVSLPGEGEFKLHISISPEQMEQAIPIVIQALYFNNDLELALKFQTARMLSEEHQIGKEFALIFSKAAEENEATAHQIEQILRDLEAQLELANIEPEAGVVVTSELIGQEEEPSLKNLEKRNLMQRKFDRAIAGSDYFYYRHEDNVRMEDGDADIAAWVQSEPKMILYSEFDEIVAAQPEFAHNPLKHPDPYLHIDFTLDP